MGLAGEGARVRLAADASFAGFVSQLLPVGHQDCIEFFPRGGNAREMMGLTVKWGCVSLVCLRRRQCG